MPTQTIPAERLAAFEKLCNHAGRVGLIEKIRIDLRTRLVVFREEDEPIMGAANRATVAGERAGRMTPEIWEQIDELSRRTPTAGYLAGLAVLTRDLIDEADYEVLTRHWAEQVGPVPS